VVLTGAYCWVIKLLLVRVSVERLTNSESLKIAEVLDKHGYNENNLDLVFRLN
jgi:hypothetical protein